MYGDVGTYPHQFMADKVTLFQSRGIFCPLHRLVPTKIFDIPAPLTTNLDLKLNLTKRDLTMYLGIYDPQGSNIVV